MLRMEFKKDKYYNLEFKEVANLSEKLDKEYCIIKGNKVCRLDDILISGSFLNEIQEFSDFYKLIISIIGDNSTDHYIEELSGRISLENEHLLLKKLCKYQKDISFNFQRVLVDYLARKLKLNKNMPFNVIPYISKDKAIYEDLVWYLHLNVINKYDDSRIYYMNSYDNIEEFNLIGNINDLKIVGMKQYYEIQKLDYKIEGVTVVSRYIIRINKNKVKINNKIYNNISRKVKLKSKFNKNILFMDRVESNGDNAEAMFHYCKDRIKHCYYIIGDQQKYNEMSKKFENIVFYGSPKFEKLYLNSKLLVSSGLDSRLENYKGWRYPNTRVKTKYLFLQHGYINDDLSDWLFSKRFDKLIVSDKQEQELVKSFYSVANSQVVNLGLARFDFLKPKSEKILLIAPTWRFYLKDESAFIKSDYLEVWNNLLSSKEISEYCMLNNLVLTLKVHPEFEKYKKYFCIQSSEKRYSDLLSEASMLITDYSSLYYDMYVLNRKTIFYQFDVKEFYRNHTYKQAIPYEKIGAGVVTDNLAELITLLEEKKEIESNNDFNNRERIFKLIKKNI